ncbi:MAG: 6-bladed beta-propeller [Melioribacteraceae bacterium]|nr:6-bladed beta-propeller [Melioribacteraceae bacterium]MCF8354543.1 6-bladed beta-propeller [Melioribacteraceae bacterium]MCF8394475.1 6-bladed beta-propeller [Melioribacteraceae bacterium]MCF8420115.1 6-bladed beta-propeller [Melioribacteraceae bacterium]
MKKINTIVIVFVAVLITNCNKHGANVQTTILVDSINVIKGITPNYMYNVEDIFIADDKLAICDAGNQRVIIMDFPIGKEPQPLVFGQKGRGPGEFVDPNAVVIRNSYIFIADRVARRLSIFDSEGNYINAINQRVFLNFAVNSHNSIFIPNVDEKFLLSEYDWNGNLLSNFAEKLEFENENMTTNHNYSNILIDKSDNIYVIFFDYPVIRKYNRDKKLVWETDLKILDEIYDAYLMNLEKIKKEPFALFGLLKDVSIDNKFLYIHPVCQKKSNHDIIKIDLSEGKFSGYIDVLDGSIKIEKLVVMNNKVIGIDWDAQVFEYNIQ